MEIARAEYNDLPSILELQKTCYKENAERYNDLTIQPLTQTLEELQKEHKEQSILKAVEGGVIVGSIRFFEKDGSCHIGKVIVHPAFQNKGIGKLLMAEAEKISSGAKKFVLFTGHRDEKNLYFYEKLGYKRVRVEETGGPVKFVHMEKVNSK